MAELRYEVDPMPSTERLAFVEEALRASFRLERFVVGERHVLITHQDGESADAIRAMTKRFFFISKSVDKDVRVEEIQKTPSFRRLAFMSPLRIARTYSSPVKGRSAQIPAAAWRFASRSFGERPRGR